MRSLNSVIDIEELEDREELGCWVNICGINRSVLPIMICKINFI